MATFNKFDVFVRDVAAGVHHLQTGTADVFKIVLTDAAPVVGNTLLANITQIANGNGYTTDGATCGAVTGAQVAGVFTFKLGTDPVWTGGPAAMAQFKYAVLYNSSAAGGPLIGWWIYAGEVILQVGDTFTVDLDQVNGVLTLQ